MSWVKSISRSNKLALYIIISFGIAGLIDSAFPEAMDVSFLIHTFLLAILLFVWCGVHAEDNGIRPPNGAKLLCGLIGVIGVPVYLFRAFGFKTGGRKLLLGLLAAVVAYLFYEAAYLLSAKIF